MISSAKRKTREYLIKRLKLPGRCHGVPFALWSRLPRNKALTVVDVGAHNGTFTKSIQHFCEVKRAILIEPIPSKAALLRKEFFPPQHEVLECVVAQQSGTLTLELNDALATSSVLRINREAPELTQVHLGTPRYLDREARTLDDIAAASKLDWIDLLKLDVQGLEGQVLGGAGQTLKRTTLIWTEVSFVALYEHSCLFADVHQLLRSSGFALLDLEAGFRAPDAELLQADALYRRKSV